MDFGIVFANTGPFVEPDAAAAFASHAEARMATFSFIEAWYNPARLHSALGYRSPMTYEKEEQQTVTADP